MRYTEIILLLFIIVNVIVTFIITNKLKKVKEKIRTNNKLFKEERESMLESIEEQELQIILLNKGKERNRERIKNLSNINKQKLIYVTDKNKPVKSARIKAVVKNNNVVDTKAFVRRRIDNKFRDVEVFRKIVD